MIVFPAHVKKDGDKLIYQTLREHSENTAKYAAESLKKIGLEHVGTLVGTGHEPGKAKLLSKEYMERGANDPDSVRRGSVNHTFAGCRYFMETYHKPDETGLSILTSELAAYAVGAHHGLFDCVNAQHENGILLRMTKEGIDYSACIHSFFEQVTTRQEMDCLFRQAENELKAVCMKINALLKGSKDVSGEALFYYGLLERMILSALIDADRRDTAEFMRNQKYPTQPDEPARAALWRKCLDFMEQKLNALPRGTPIQAARRRISDQCADFAKRPSGIYRLNVPTGGGKTLSSLRYALHHALKWKKSRIILTSSLLSVLDQNAAVIRSYLPQDVQILEHHSNVVRPKDKDEQIQWEMMTEQYSPNIIITTLVQLLNTLFSGKGSCIRRFQALSDSVIVIDEVQTVPNNLLTLFNLAMNFLAGVCNTTIILCSATQPALELAIHPLQYCQEEIVPYDAAIWSVFQRTKICDAGAFRLSEIPEFIYEKIQAVDNLLVVCNTKLEAMNLFTMLSSEDILCYHLSASMCMRHRQDILKRIQRALKKQKNGTCRKKVICVSTQVIEAGVDISFACVVRLSAGLDNIVQAAGRCNRNGETPGTVPVYVVQCIDEKLKHLQDIQIAKDAYLSLSDAYSGAPEQFMHDMASSASIQYYYRTLYEKFPRGYQDDYISKLDCTIYKLLSSNDSFLQGTDYGRQFAMNQAFKTAGDAFTVFEQNTTDVLVSYIDGRKISNELYEMSKQYTVDYKRLGQLLQKAKPYTISLYQYQLDTLEQCGAIEELFQGRIRVLLDGFYDDNTGFFLNWVSGNLLEV